MLTWRYLFIRRMHCCEAFSLSQSVLSVGSQDVAWIWERRPAPARFAGAPGSPRPMLGGRDGVTDASTEPVELTTPLSWLSRSEVMWCATPGDAAARPVSAATAGGGEAGKKWPKLGTTWAPLPWLDATASSPASSAMVSRLCSLWLWDFWAVSSTRFPPRVSNFSSLRNLASLYNHTVINHFYGIIPSVVSALKHTVSVMTSYEQLLTLTCQAINLNPTYHTYRRSHTFPTPASLCVQLRLGFS